MCPPSALCRNVFMVVVVCAFFLSMAIFTTRSYIEMITKGYGPMEYEIQKKLMSISQQKTSNNNKLHILLLSYARSGSSFLGDLLQSYSKVFYVFEPFHYFTNKMTSLQTQKSSQFLYDIFNCDFSKWRSFLSWTRRYKQYKNLERNYRFWTACSLGRDTNRCYNFRFVSSFCKKQLMQVIKVIRVSIIQVKWMLQTNPGMNLKVIHLIRDPRGTMRSRLMEEVIASWCKKSSCSNPMSLCTQINNDLNYACKMASMFSGKYKLLRYEDLARKPLETAQDLFQFLGLDTLPKEVIDFVESHTKGIKSIKKQKQTEKWAYSTFRNSSETVFSWVNQLPFKTVLNIQSTCKSVLDRLGYVVLSSPPHSKNHKLLADVFNESNVC